MSACPHCESQSGYFRKVQMSGAGLYYYTADGEVGDNEHLHDNLKYRESKTMYCADCRQPIGKAKSTKEPA